MAVSACDVEVLVCYRAQPYPVFGALPALSTVPVHEEEEQWLGLVSGFRESLLAQDLQEVFILDFDQILLAQLLRVSTQGSLSE